MEPERIGRYVVKKEIGRGGMATVYAAFDPMTNRDVAIKVLPRELLHDQTFRARFEREARMVAALEHQAIVPVYDFGEGDGQPFFVMRLMTGGSLSDKIKKGPMKIEEVVRILSRIAPALDEAHVRGIVHRDLKPANILFDQHGDPYLSDFGIAKLAHASGTLTGDAIVGTPAYMSPEQGRGESDLDGRSDIYSLGVIVYEMLSGRVPFEAETPMGQVVKHITAPPPNIMQARPDLPPAVQQVINRVMDKRKFVRHATASELAKELEQISRGQVPDYQKPTMVQSSPGADYQRPTVQRMEIPPMPPTASASSGGKGWLIGVIVVLGVLLVGALAVGGFFVVQSLTGKTATITIASVTETKPVVGVQPTLFQETPPEPTRTKKKPVDATQTATPEVTMVAVLDTATPTPEPSITPTLPASTPTRPVLGGADRMALIKDNDIWVVNMDGGDLKRLTNTGGKKSGLQFTPDGTEVSYVMGRCVQAVNIENGQIRDILCVRWAEYLAAFEISPDGKFVALSLSDGLFILPYDLEKIGAIKRQDQLLNADICVKLTDYKTKKIRWSGDSKAVAAILIGSVSGSAVDLVRVMDVSRCGQPPVRMDEFPGNRFTPNGYEKLPLIQSLAWDGDQLFSLNASVLNGLGEWTLYNTVSKKSETLAPLESCCYRDFRWSPDAQYIVFVYRELYSQNASLYLVPFGSLGTGSTYQPFAFPENFISSTSESAEIVFRPAQ